MLNSLKLNKHKIKKHPILIVVCVLFSIYAISLVFPFVWMLYNSFKTNVDFVKNVWSMPTTFKFSNYTDVIFHYKVHGHNMAMMFFNSIFLTFAGTFLAIFFSAVLAYIIAKYKFFGRNFLYSLAIFIMVVPVAGTLPAQYQIMQWLHLNSSLLGVLVLYSGAFGFNFLILFGFFKNLSWEYAEAAIIDGCNEFKIFFNIMLPLSKPSLIAVGIIHGIGVWNDYVVPSVYLPNTPTLAVGVNELMHDMQSHSKFPEMFATMIIALIPILVVFIAFQKTIMENTIAGGLKG